jgi:hypothetical protein
MTVECTPTAGWTATRHADVSPAVEFASHYKVDSNRMTSTKPDPLGQAEPRPYRTATEDVPPPTREVALRDAGFWLEQLEASMDRVESGRGTAHDQRVLHQGPLVAQRLLTYAELEDRERWAREYPAVAKVVAEALSASVAGEPYDPPRAEVAAALYRPHFERAFRDLEVLRLRLTPS